MNSLNPPGKAPEEGISLPLTKKTLRHIEVKRPHNVPRRINETICGETQPLALSRCSLNITACFFPMCWRSPSKQWTGPTSGSLDKIYTKRENTEEVSAGHKILEKQSLQVFMRDALESFADSDVNLKVQQLSEVLMLERMGKTRRVDLPR